MPALLDRLYCMLQSFIRTVISILLSLMVIIVFCNVISRYYLDATLAWSEEISRFMLIWLVFLGAVLAYVKDEHLGLDLMVKYLPDKLRLSLAVAADLMIMFAIWILISGGCEMAAGSWIWEAPASEIPYGYIYLIIPFSGGVMMLQTILKMVNHIRALFGFPEVKSC